jgi:acyl-CoA hydrolase
VDHVAVTVLDSVVSVVNIPAEAVALTEGNASNESSTDSVTPVHVQDVVAESQTEPAIRMPFAGTLIDPDGSFEETVNVANDIGFIPYAAYVINAIPESAVPEKTRDAVVPEAMGVFVTKMDAAVFVCAAVATIFVQEIPAIVQLDMLLDVELLLSWTTTMTTYLFAAAVPIGTVTVGLVKSPEFVIPA